MTDFKSIDPDINLMKVIRSSMSPENERAQAREELYIKYSEILVQYARALGASAEDAEDMAHEALIRALITKSDQFEPQGNGSFKAWVRRIVQNLHFNARRRHKIEGDILAATGMEQEVDPFDSINSNEDIYRAAGLSELETTVATYYIDYGLKPREIAYFMPDHSPENISRIIYRLKVKLR